MTFLSKLRRVSAALTNLLDEDDAISKRQLQQIRDKTRKLKKRCRELAEFLGEMEESCARTALHQEYELALALRRKAHDKYHQLKELRRDRKKQPAAK